MPGSDLSYLPKGFPFRRRGGCVPAAYLILRDALANWFAVEGYVGPTEQETVHTLSARHTWVITHLGEIVDPTIRQFEWWRAGIIPHREERRRIPRSTFLWNFEELLHTRTLDREAREHYRAILQSVDQMPAPERWHAHGAHYIRISYGRSCPRGWRAATYERERGLDSRFEPSRPDRNTGRTVLGAYGSPEAALEAAKMAIDGIAAPERVCNLRDIDRVRKENREKARA